MMKPGDRVQLSSEGLRLFRGRQFDLRGTVDSVDYGMVLKIIWDGRTHRESLHAKFLEPASGDLLPGRTV